jgi:DNA-binding transcriptional MerR regulator
MLYMGHAAVVIPEKLFFKIGEVCDIVGVQAHVLRYWESEFPMLAPQKNRAGQRTYRKRDVEMALRIKELLYDELYTIPGARKRLSQEIRGASKLKVVTSDMAAAPASVSNPADAVSTATNAPEDVTTSALESHVAATLTTPARNEGETAKFENLTLTDAQRQSVRRLYNELQELLILLDSPQSAVTPSRK